MKSFPWDSLNLGWDNETNLPIYDRDYTASDLREVYETFFSNGVFLDDSGFSVTAGEGMNAIMSAGKCCINGTVGYEKNDRGLAIQASSSQDRIDTVVLRWNANIEMRNIDVYVKTGVAQEIPVRPALTRSETVYELGIADIFVTKNSGAISAARITDTRLNDERCGVVTPFAHIDTSTFYEQIQAAIDENVADLREQTNIAIELAQSAIDGTTAGNLQNQITENKTAIEENKEIEDRRNADILAKFANDGMKIYVISKVIVPNAKGDTLYLSSQEFLDLVGRAPIRAKDCMVPMNAHGEANDGIVIYSAVFYGGGVYIRSSAGNGAQARINTILITTDETIPPPS